MSSDPLPYTREELASLLAFYADAGLDYPLDEVAADRFQASASDDVVQSVREPQPKQPIQRAVSSAPPVVPDGQAVSEAESIAAAANDLDALALAVDQFTGCNLKRSARHTVFEGGQRGAKLMLVQAAPSREDDATGLAFQGQNGALLSAMFGAIGLERDTGLYAGFCVPWCPPGGQQPTELHMQICLPFLKRQIELAAPDCLIVMGNGPAQMLFKSRQTILRLRGNWQSLIVGERTIDALPMLPTSILLDEPMLKRNAWFDLLSLKDHLQAAH